MIDKVDSRRKLQAARLRQARQERGFKSARAAALRFHWLAVTYNKHESGERGIGRAVRKYARAFRVEEAWLLGLHEGQKSNEPLATAEIERLRAALREIALRASTYRESADWPLISDIYKLARDALD